MSKRSRSAAAELSRLLQPLPVMDAASAPVSLDDAASLNERTGLPLAVGRLYACVNPAWPGLVKLGSSGDLSKRLSDYQTSSPYRDYRMVAFSCVYQDVRRAEFALHDQLAECKVEGSREWFRITEAQAITLLGSKVAIVALDDWIDT